ncbi:MAG: hypothetical protein RBU37_19960 [Myxococcota bacterium]|jgi:hypothetical protein|nr:hypothetical protein [Myxococcota bacterium]
MEINIGTGAGALTFQIIMAAVCYSMASSRNRSPILWAVLGFFFGCLVPIVLAIIGNARSR